MSYFTDKDDNLEALIRECSNELDEVVRADYLINCLVLKHRANMTVKEIFEAELKAKQEFEADLAERRKS